MNARVHAMQNYSDRFFFVHEHKHFCFQKKMVIYLPQLNNKSGFFFLLNNVIRLTLLVFLTPVTP